MTDSHGQFTIHMTLCSSYCYKCFKNIEFSVQAYEGLIIIEHLDVFIREGEWQTCTHTHKHRKLMQ